MLPFRSILCPVDFSAHAAEALRYAAALASMSGARLTVAWITDPLLAQAAVVYTLDPHGEQARADLRDFVAKSLTPGTGARTEPELVLTVGKADREILKIARAQHADLIVMGTHGLSGYRKLFFGSTTERVLRHTTTPVLAVPLDGDAAVLAAAPPLEMASVVIALDLGPTSAPLAAFGVTLATALKARPVLLHVVSAEGAPSRWQPALEAHQRSAQDQARTELSQIARAAGHVAETVVSPGHPAEEIAGLARTRDAGLIVMGLAGQSGLLDARPGSIAYRVLILTPTPVLVVPPAALPTLR